MLKYTYKLHGISKWHSGKIDAKVIWFIQTKSVHCSIVIQIFSQSITCY